MQKFLMALTTAVFLSTGAAAEAGLIGSIGLKLENVALATGVFSDPLPSFSFDLSSSLNTDGDYNALASVYNLGSAIAFDPAAPTLFTFSNAAFGTFTGLSVVTDSHTAFGLDFTVTGNFIPSGAIAAFGATQSDLLIHFSKVGNTIEGTAILYSPSGQQDLPPIDPRTPGLINPEPASIAMFGTMLVPLAFGAFRRRQKAAQAAL